MLALSAKLLTSIQVGFSFWISIHFRPASVASYFKFLHNRFLPHLFSSSSVLLALLLDGMQADRLLACPLNIL
jgi:phosphoglycerol transferase MdoB-like AlkP superfamily enzyme